MDVNATTLLTEVTQGNEAAAARLAPLVYNELRDLARRYLPQVANQGAATLQPTALVHEAYLRLVNQGAAVPKGRTHFYALAAVALRHVLIDHVRARKRVKRGAGWRRITVADVVAVTRHDQLDALALDEALVKLAELDERAARVVELRFFGGLTEQDVAEVLGVSERTVRNDWSMARAWLRCELGDGDHGKAG